MITLKLLALTSGPFGGSQFNKENKQPIKALLSDPDRSSKCE